MVVRSTVSKAVNSSVRVTTGSGGGAGGGGGSSYDSDAQTYFTAVEAADGESLETGVKDAINAFVVGCKDDGIWTAIKTSCILAGARTLGGALVPLVGAAPINVNFVSGDYSRTAGLKGNASTKYLASGRLESADPQNSKHLAVYRIVAPSSGTRAEIGSASASGASVLLCAAASRFTRVNENVGAGKTGTANISGFWGASRSGATAVTERLNGPTTVFSDASQAPPATTIDVFRRGATGQHSDSGIGFYSIGEAVDMELLESRVSTLITAIGAALA